MKNTVIKLISLFLILVIYKKYSINKKYSNKKFFNEIPYHPHLDIRYGKKDPDCECKTLCFGCGMDNKNLHSTLIYLLKRFMEYSKQRNIKPILMYGNLIGYYFNGKMLPWDDDIDLIIVGESIKNMENYEAEDFIIEINPYSNIYDQRDTQNKISGRVISKINGIFIDLTFYIEKNGYLICKDGNKFLKEDVLPPGGEDKLKTSFFEGIEIYLPNNIKNCLSKRYGENVFIPLDSEGYKFNDKTKEWEDNVIIKENRICCVCYNKPCKC